MTNHHSVASGDDTAGAAFDADVLIAGAGPTGLMLAGELRAAGVRTLLLERRTDVDPTVKAGAVGPLAVEALHRRPAGETLGRAADAAMVVILENLRSGSPELDAWLRPLEEAGHPPSEVARRAAAHFGFGGKGHFAGLFMIDAAKRGDPDRAMAVVAQQQLEELLWADLTARPGPVRVHRGVAVTAVGQDADAVTVTAEDANGGPRRFRARWLVACDGGRSTVRKLTGFDFPGTAPTMTAHQIVADYADPDVLLPRGWRRTPTGIMAYGPTPGRVLAARFDGPPDVDRDAPITVAEAQRAVRYVSGTDVEITALHSATRFTDNARQASDYRSGRVLLAGDAAHVHSPFGGQGLNLGLLDAVNLGWKLAAVVDGWAARELLDTYTAERHPVGAAVLANTRAQVALMRPGPEVDALRDVLAELLEEVDEANAFFGRMLGGFTTAHAMPYADGVPEQTMPLLGRPVPDLRLADGTRLAERMRDGGGLLVLPGADGTQAAGRPGRITVAAAGLAAEEAHRDVGALLVRPDGIAAWSAAAGAAPDTALLDKALTTWFGPAAEATA